LAPSEQTTASDRAALPRVIRRSVALAVLGSAVLAAPAAALQLGPDAPHSPNTDDMTTAWWVMLIVGLAVLVAVNGALLAALVRFRARRGTTPARITAGRRVMGRAAGALGVVALAIFVFGVVMSVSARTVDDSGSEALEASAGQLAQVPISDVPDTAVPAGSEEETGQVPETGQGEEGAPLEIDAIAQQWVWRFEYPSQDREDIATLFSYGELVVPVDTTVILNVTSTDVVHSWWVPSLTGQVQAIPGTIAQTWFRADEVGTYSGGGTVFDGTTYPSLGAKVRVVEAAEFQPYLEGLATDLTEAQESVVEAAESAAAAPAEGEGQAP
jgi:cytochrome c oxidase subunit 2